jgi:hypothetical protein
MCAAVSTVTVIQNSTVRRCFFSQSHRWSTASVSYMSFPVNFWSLLLCPLSWSGSVLCSYPRWCLKRNIPTTAQFSRYPPVTPLFSKHSSTNTGIIRGVSFELRTCHGVSRQMAGFMWDEAAVLGATTKRGLVVDQWVLTTDTCSLIRFKGPTKGLEIFVRPFPFVE